MQKVPYAQLATNCLKLPRLPVPPLADTLNRYRDSIAPLKKADAVAAHLTKLKAWEDSTAGQVQQRLVDQDAAHAAAGTYPNSYIEALWDEGYLGFRGPLTVNINPAFSFRRIPNLSGQAETAVAYVTGMLRWIEKLTSGDLDVPTKNPSGISSLNTQFAFSRVPMPKRDELRQADLTKARTITVMCNNRLFSLDVKDANGQVFPQDVLVSAMKHIFKVAHETESVGPALGYLTGGGRSDWATSYADLIAMDPQNEKVLKEIQDSLIVVCLDSEAWGKDTQAKLGAMLYGGNEIGNRWYDKHQLIVDPDGAAAMCFEHSFSDGVNWSRWIQEVYSSIKGEESGFSPLPKLKVAAAADSASIVRPLEVKVGKTFGARIRTAEQELQKLSKGVLLEEVVIPFGKNRLKKLGVSPDAFCQSIMHWSYYQLRSKVAPTYESCSTGTFWHGRTETIRSATTEMKSLITSCDLDALGSVSTETAIAISQNFAAAAEKHVKLAKEAAQGLGVDRHLLALKEIAKETNDTNGLAFFNDELFQYSGTWTLSTSNVSMNFIDTFNFGPVTPHGLGIGYVISDDEIHMGVSSFRLSSKTKIKEFCGKIDAGSKDLVTVLEKAKK
jgi:hypothetical protein